MSNLAIDVETTKAPNHYPWIEGSALVCLSTAKESGETRTWFFNHPVRDKLHPNQTFRESVDEIQAEIAAHKRIIAHNLKFDLHWLRYLGLDLSRSKLYCTMLGEYLVNAQYKQDGIKLAELSEVYGLPMKKDKVKIYWDAGVDTPDIPHHILQPYCEQDTINALAIYQRQVPRILGNNLETIVAMEMEVLRCANEMEWNGMALDTEKLERYNRVYGEELVELDKTLAQELQIDNPNSGDQLSIALFGFKEREGLFDAKRFNIEALKKEGYYSTAVPELLKLKGRTPRQKKILDMLKHRSRLEQMRATYFNGLQKHLIGNMIHHTINQCVTITGRTSCSKPNLQNQPRGNTGPVKECFITQWR